MLILAPTAGSVPAENNAEYIVGIAKSLKADLLIIHITTNEASKDGLKALEIFSKAGKKVNVKVDAKVVVGKVVEKILETAKESDVDLIVMGASHGVVVHEWFASHIMGQGISPVVIIPSGLDEIDVE